MTPTTAGPQPRDVPGYAQARARGRTPQVPATAPAVAVTPSSRAALRHVALVGGAGVSAVLLVLLGGENDGRLSWASVFVLLAVSAAAAGALAVAVRRWGRAQIAELQRGYTTTTFAMGRFWFAASPDGPVTHGWVQWRWDGTWVLRCDGRVVSAPSAAGDPPGLYPSPHHAGELELWTGCQWSGYRPARRGPTA